MVLHGCNPVIPADYPDPDVIRVGDTNYMLTTTMHMFPGAQLLRSKNLVQWEHAGYVYEKLNDTADERLDGGNIYGKGMWAGTLRYFNNQFHVLFVCNDTQTTYHFTAENPGGPWTRHEMEGFFYDSSVLFDDDGRVYIAYGNREIRITELKADLSGPMPGGLDRTAVRDREDIMLGYEGTHFYKIHGRYYLFCIHWAKEGTGRRTQACFVSDTLDGEFVGGDILDDDMGYHNMGIAQGCVIDTEQGDWFLMLFQDRGAAGRMPVLVSMEWKDGFPVAIPAQKHFSLIGETSVDKIEPLYSSDSLRGLPLSARWQWNHEPHDLLWSVSSDGLCLITDRVVVGLEESVNTLTQRTFEPGCEVEVTVQADSLKPGDHAGLCALMGCYAQFSVTREENGYALVLLSRVADEKPYAIAPSTESVAQRARILWDKPSVRLRARFEFVDLHDRVRFFYEDDNKWFPIGDWHRLVYRLDHFMGCRAGLFCYSTEVAGGKAFFQDFVYRINVD